MEQQRGNHVCFPRESLMFKELGEEAFEHGSVGA